MADEMMDGFVGFGAETLVQGANSAYDAGSAVANAAGKLVGETASLVGKVAKAPLDVARWMFSPGDDGLKFSGVAGAVGAGTAATGVYYAVTYTAKGVGAGAGWVATPTGAAVVVGAAATGGLVYAGRKVYRNIDARRAHDKSAFAKHEPLRTLRTAVNDANTAKVVAAGYAKDLSRTRGKAAKLDSKLEKAAVRKGGMTKDEYRKLTPELRAKLAVSWGRDRTLRRLTEQTKVLGDLEGIVPGIVERRDSTAAKARQARDDVRMHVPPADLPRGRRVRRQLGLGKSQGL